MLCYVLLAGAAAAPLRAEPGLLQAGWPGCGGAPAVNKHDGGLSVRCSCGLQDDLAAACTPCLLAVALAEPAAGAPGEQRLNLGHLVSRPLERCAAVQDMPHDVGCAHIAADPSQRLIRTSGVQAMKSHAMRAQRGWMEGCALMATLP